MQTSENQCNISPVCSFYTNKYSWTEIYMLTGLFGVVFDG